jgi:hypothetical protein
MLQGSCGSCGLKGKNRTRESVKEGARIQIAEQPYEARAVVPHRSKLIYQLLLGRTSMFQMG